MPQVRTAPPAPPSASELPSSSAQPVSSRPSHSVARRLVPHVAAAGVLAAAAVAVVARDPHVPGSWGTCPVLALTGRYCPGCGSLRAVHDLLTGHLGAAVAENALAVAVLPLLVWTLVGGAWTAATGRTVPDLLQRRGAPVVVLVAYVGFGILRNTAWGAALAP